MGATAHRGGLCQARLPTPARHVGCIGASGLKSLS